MRKNKVWQPVDREDVPEDAKVLTVFKAAVGVHRTAGAKANGADGRQ